MSLEGTIPALLTPFQDGEVDLSTMLQHLDWLRGRGIRCVNAMGTTGEGPSLSLVERKLVVELVAASGVDFIAGTGTTSLPETIELSRYALAHGALAVLVVPPSYFEPEDLTAWYTALFEALPDEGRVLLYHIPRLSYPISDELVRVLRKRFAPMLAGMKDSSGDLAHTIDWLEEFPDLVVCNGDDSTAAPFYAAGGRTVITACSNVLPAELEAIRAGQVELQPYVAEVRALAQSVPRTAALKLLLQIVSGLPRSSVRPPLAELTREQEAAVAHRFAELRSGAHVASR